MHLHLHVLPVHDPEDRPASVFSWQEGVYVAERREWEALREQYVRAWAEDGAPRERAPAITPARCGV